MSLPSTFDRDKHANWRQRVLSQGRRVHVSTSTTCNNNCLFCMEEGGKRGGYRDPMTPERFASMIPSLQGADEVCFTSGEPTLNHHLFDMVAMAREAGAPHVSVMTNGRRLAYVPYLLGLIEAGVDRIYVSIHGHTAKLHDSLTRTPGSFEQTWRGLELCRRLVPQVEVRTSTVLVRRNAPFLLEIYEKLRSVGVRQVVFNALQLDGRAERLFERIMPRYELIRHEVDRLVRQARDGGRRAFVVDVPPCVLEGLPDFIKGYLEKRVVVEADRRELAVARQESGEVHTAQAVDPVEHLRVFGPPCEECSYRGACTGVYETYVRRYGWEEFGLTGR